ncbi:MAG: hypothetical protein OXT65_00740 [Alphaproteobacteria bacterium]|nr:hypothetical protein [Alphaproteobacteria bacterium]
MDSYDHMWKAAKDKNWDAVRALLEADACDATDRANTLTWALHYGDREMAGLLVSHGVDPYEIDTGSGKPPISYARSDDMREFVAQKSIELGLCDNITMSYSLAGHGIKEVYSFPKKERISFALNAKGEICGLMRQPFADIQSLPDLRKAFDMHRARGGKTPEEEVFGDGMRRTVLKKILKPG